LTRAEIRLQGLCANGCVRLDVIGDDHCDRFPAAMVAADHCIVQPIPRREDPDILCDRLRSQNVHAFLSNARLIGAISRNARRLRSLYRADTSHALLRLAACGVRSLRATRDRCEWIPVGFSFLSSLS